MLGDDGRINKIYHYGRLTGLRHVLGMNLGKIGTGIAQRRKFGAQNDVA